MKISLSLSKIIELKDSLTRDKIENMFGWSCSRKAYDTQDLNEAELSQSYSLDLSTYKIEDIKKLRDVFVKISVHKKTLTTMENWIKSVENTDDVIITSLPHLKTMIEQAVKKHSKKWLYYERGDGFLIPVAVERLDCKTLRDDGGQRVYLSVCKVDYTSESSYFGSSDEISKKITLEKSSVKFYFYRDDITEITDDVLENMHDYSDDDNDEEDDAPKKKKTNTKSKKGNFLLTKILSDKKLYFATKELDAQYEEQVLKAENLRRKIGNVFVSDGKGFIINEGYSSQKLGYVNSDNIVAKLVVDDSKIKDDFVFSGSGDLGSYEIPVVPYCLFYDVANYRYVVSHVDNVKPYVFDESLIDKLVLKQKTKDVLKSLIGSENDFQDIVKGKSGGIVVLSSGGAGLGKTLTAEVYAELMKKPLYSVQSAQLGVEVKSIEKNLQIILQRAEKWNAVLLLDECDTYVKRRGDDIVQNAIVTTFLRLMEYYNGILFLTTNIPDQTDDAIMSRVTLHIPYKLPTEEENFELWKVLTKNFNLTISDETINAIWNKYNPISGRDIRNTLKDIVKIYKNESDVTLDKFDYLAEYLPFAKERK